MGNIDADTIGALGNTLETIEIVERAPGAGLRMILHMRTRHGSPVVETCARHFPTLAEAENYAEAEFGAIEIGMRLART